MGDTALNAAASRYSLIVFKNPRKECAVFASSELVDEAHPRRCRAVTWEEYLGVITKGSTKAGHLIEKITIA